MQIIKKTINKIPFLKRYLVSALIWRKAINLFIYDAKIFVRNSFALKSKDDYDVMVTTIELCIHSIEKGLSMKSTRLFFGKDRILTLIETLINNKELLHKRNKDLYDYSLEVIKEYRYYHFQNSKEVDFITEYHVLALGLEDPDIINNGATITLNKRNIAQNILLDFKVFSRSRHSVRNFSEKKVDVDKIISSIELSQNSPSACNRQSINVVIVENEEMCFKIANKQKGCRGFGEHAKCFLVITSDLTAYGTINDRNIPYLDGGIFAMNLLYSLHYNELAACILMWNPSEENNLMINKELNIDEKHKVICVIAVGNYPDGDFKVAKSKRKNNAVLKIIS